MVQGYPQKDSGGFSGWPSDRRAAFHAAACRARIEDIPRSTHHGGPIHEQRLAFVPEGPDISGTTVTHRKTGGAMLSVTGIHHFYYIPSFTDMRCKHSRVLSIIREQLHREPNDGDVFIVMSKDRRIVRMFTYDNRSYSLFEKKFVSGYQFMKVVKNGDENAYRIDWKDVVLLLENPIVKELKIK